MSVLCSRTERTSYEALLTEMVLQQYFNEHNLTYYMTAFYICCEVFKAQLCQCYVAALKVLTVMILKRANKRH